MHALPFPPLKFHFWETSVIGTHTCSMYITSADPRSIRSTHQLSRSLLSLRWIQIDCGDRITVFILIFKYWVDLNNTSSIEWFKPTLQMVVTKPFSVSSDVVKVQCYFYDRWFLPLDFHLSLGRDHVQLLPAEMDYVSKIINSVTNT